jgi:hypothetical protein
LFQSKRKVFAHPDGSVSGREPGPE